MGDACIMMLPAALQAMNNKVGTANQSIQQVHLWH